MGDPANFNTVLQFCVKSIIEKIPKIQMGTPPNLTTAAAEVKTTAYLPRRWNWVQMKIWTQAVGLSTKKIKNNQKYCWHTPITIKKIFTNHDGKIFYERKLKKKEWGCLTVIWCQPNTPIFKDVW